MILLTGTYASYSKCFWVTKEVIRVLHIISLIDVLFQKP